MPLLMLVHVNCCAGGLKVTLTTFWVELLSVSLATTVIVFAPETSVTVPLQLAVPLPLAVPPLALAPLTVTEEMPLLPTPLSLAVPLTGKLALVTTTPLAGELIVNAGGVVSGGVTVPFTTVTLFWAFCVIPPIV